MFFGISESCISAFLLSSDVQKYLLQKNIFLYLFKGNLKSIQCQCVPNGLYKL